MEATMSSNYCQDSDQNFRVVKKYSYRDATFLFQWQCCKPGIRLSGSIFIPMQSEPALDPSSKFNSPSWSIYAAIALHSSMSWSHNTHMTFYVGATEDVDHWT